MWQTFFDVIFPPSSDELLVRSASVNSFDNFSSRRIDGSTYTLLPYTDPLVRACIHEAKFHHNKKAIVLLANTCKRFLEAQKQQTLLIPIPLSKTRERERGYNQVTEIVREAITHTENLELRTGILARTRNTKPQTDTLKEDRYSNVQGAFVCTNPNVVRNRDVILIDDVFTTGSTMYAAKKELLKQHPTSLICVALSH